MTDTEREPVDKLLLPAGFIVHVEGLPFYLAVPTAIEGTAGNIRMVRRAMPPEGPAGPEPQAACRLIRSGKWCIEHNAPASHVPQTAPETALRDAFEHQGNLWRKTQDDLNAARERIATLEMALAGDAAAQPVPDLMEQAAHVLHQYGGGPLEDRLRLAALSLRAALSGERRP